MHRAAQCHTGCHTHQSTQPPCDAAPRRMPLSLWLHHLLAPLSSSTELHTDEICIQVRSTQVVFNSVAGKQGCEWVRCSFSRVFARRAHPRQPTINTLTFSSCQEILFCDCPPKFFSCASFECVQENTSYHLFICSNLYIHDFPPKIVIIYYERISFVE